MNKKILIVLFCLLAFCGPVFAAAPAIAITLDSFTNATDTIDLAVSNVTVTVAETNTSDTVCTLNVDGAGAVAMINSTHFVWTLYPTAAEGNHTAVVSCTGDDFDATKDIYIAWGVDYSRNTIIGLYIDNIVLSIAEVQRFGANIAGYFASNTDTLGPILFIGILVGVAFLTTRGNSASKTVSKFKK